jgi:DNA-binding NarL/FixJ family response regulator
MNPAKEKPMSTIKVAIVEDNASVRGSLATILNGSPGFRCVCACASSEEALQRIPAAAPDVILMDINLPGQSGIECVRQLRQQPIPGQIIMLTIEEDSRRVFQSLEAGASGYLVKHLPPAKILEAIQEVHRGGAPMSSQVARLLVQSFHRRGPSSLEAENLTAREEEILRLVAQGYRTKEVAEALAISAQTVETHLRNTYEKLHVRSRAAAVARFIQRGDRNSY